MLISESKSFLFYHVYKVAGTSIRDVLRPYVSTHQVLLQNLNYMASIAKLDLGLAPIYSFHPRLEDVRDYLGPKFYEYYRFSFVRNPLDWQKSLYYFMQINKRHHQHSLIKNMTFEEYLRWRMDKELKLQSSLISSRDGELLVNDVYRFENIDSEFDILKSKLGIDGQLPHKNVAGLGKKATLSRDIKDEFLDKFSLDYELLGYPKEIL